MNALWTEAKAKNEERTETEKKVLLESNGHENKEMVYKIQGGGRRKLKVTYTNVNGLSTASTELNDYLKRNKPDIMGLTEIKLDKSFELLNIGDGEYEIWKKSTNQTRRRDYDL